MHLAQGDLPPHVFITLPSVGVPDEPAVAWDAQDPNDDALTVSLALSADDGRTWETLETGLPATGRYTLTTATNSQATYRAKATASDGIYRVSAESAAFQGHVTAEDSLLQLSFEEMNQDATWSRTMPIRWSARYDGHESVAIDLAASDNGGQSWTTIARNLDNSGVYAWDTSTTANGVYLLQVMAHTAQASRTIVTTSRSRCSTMGATPPPSRSYRLAAARCGRGRRRFAGAPTIRTATPSPSAWPTASSPRRQLEGAGRWHPGC